MLKALLKKQFLEINTFYFTDRKTGKRRSKKGIIGCILLYALLFTSLGFAFYEMASMVGSTLLPTGLDWLYFALTGIIAVFMGVFGGVFNTYAGLYLAKDNELLLSMPIPSGKILTVRMVGVYLMGLMYEALVFIPVLIAYFVIGTPTVLAVVNGVLLVFLLGFFVLVLCCLLGWLVALIASRLKSKSFIVVLVSLAFFAVYYFVCFNFYNTVQKVLENIERVGAAMKSAAYPLYLLGMAASGDTLSMLLFTLLTAVLVVLTYVVLSRSFLKIATHKTSGAKAVYRETPVRVSGTEKALLRREWKRFSGSATYMLNCALGTVLMPAAGIALLIFSARIREALAMASELLPEGAILIIGMVILGLTASMNDISAPSVSLEGKNLWIMQSLPVDPSKILRSKQKLHHLVTIPPAVFLAAAFGIVIGADFTEIVMLALFACAFVMLSAAAGLAINLKRPNLTWTNETTPIKQSFAVMMCLFGGWLAAIVLGALAFFGLKVLEPWQVVFAAAVIILLATRILNRWLQGKGAAIYATL